MRTFSQSKALLLMAIILACVIGLSAQNRRIEISSNENQVRLSNNSDYGFDLSYKLGELGIREVQTSAGFFDELFIEGWGYTNIVGDPKLPMNREFIAVPVGANVRFNIKSQSTEEIPARYSQLSRRIIPAQEPISRSQDTKTAPFTLNDASYGKSGFNTRDWVEIQELGYLRGVRLFTVDYFPVRYDPVTSSIKVMHSLELRVDFENPDLAATADLLAKTASAEFDKLYAQTILNWNADTRTQLVRHPTKMVILCPVGYTSYIQDFVDWKVQQGIAVSVATVGTGGMMANTYGAIKAYMQSIWNAATASDPAPTYLLIIGDESGDIQVPAYLGTAGNHITDNTYVRLQGSDFIPEMYHGRFSVANTDELAAVIHKTITYEKTLMPDLSYLGKSIITAGIDNVFGATHANGVVNYLTQNYFNTNQNITSDSYFYPTSTNYATEIRNKASEGRGIIYYTGHGGYTLWGDPEFKAAHVNAMTNYAKYGVMIGNCCITNWFNHNVPCFGEAILRKANAGGVAYIGSIDETFWNEDYYWAVGFKIPITGTAPAYHNRRLGAFDALFHTHNEEYKDWATTLGELVFMGNTAVMKSSSSKSNYYWESYQIMGDPSLSAYLRVPDSMNASYADQITSGQSSFLVSGTAPYARVAISKDGVIYGVGLADANGYLEMPLNVDVNAGTATLVITAQNHITVIDELEITPAEISLDAPELVISRDANGIMLSWQSVDGADAYQIYRSQAPYEDFGTEPVATVDAPNTSWIDPQIDSKAFYKVIAIQIP